MATTALWVAALSPVSAATPGCLVDAPAATHHPGAVAAGCYIKRGDRLLLVRQRGSGRLGFPAGYVEAGESAQCAAHRETWEEAGVEVVVGPPLKKFGNGFVLYRCHLLDDRGDHLSLPVPATGQAEVDAVLWLDPTGIDPGEWRFPWQWPGVIELHRRDD